MKSNFYEIRFLAENSIGSSGGPEFLTEIITTLDSKETRNKNWSAPRNKYNLAPAIRNSAQLEYLISFFRICNGRAIGFRFKDWSDYKILNQEIGIGDGIKKEFQIFKSYRISDYNIERKISKPVVGTVEIYVGEKRVDIEIDCNIGLIKFVKLPKLGGIIKISCEFDVPVRFDIDNLMISSEGKDLYSNPEIILVEIKI